MKRIDFLPDSYRLRLLRQRGRRFETIVLCLFGVVVGCTFATQSLLRYGAAREMAAVERKYDSARGVVEQYEAMKKEAADLAGVANFYTILKHPWPRTQVLAAVAERLPAELTLREVQLVNEGAAGPATQGPPKPEEKDAKQPPVERDLKQILSDSEKSRTVIYLTGRAAEPSLVYTYVLELSRSPLFAAVKVESLSAGLEDDARHAAEFRIRIQLKPGYGVPGGPSLAIAATPVVAPTEQQP